MAIEEEIRELEQRFAESPESRLFLPLADALKRAGELERAVEICSRGLQSFQDFVSARVLLAQCLAELGQMETAREQFEIVLAEDDENFEALKGLGQLAAENGDAGRALDLLTRAREIEPQDEEVIRAAEALEAAPAETAAVEETEAGEIFMTHTLGDIYRLQGHYQRAFEVYNRLMELSPGDRSLAGKLQDVASRLPSSDAEPSAALPEENRVEPAPGEIEVSASDHTGDDDIGRRIECIFASVLNHHPAEKNGRKEMDRPAAEGSFVNMFERWIKGLRLLEAG